MKENYIYYTLQRWLKNVDDQEKLHELELIRIESGSTINGLPDIYFDSKYFTGWIEDKQITWPKRKTTNIKIPWRPGQRKFLNNIYNKHNRFLKSFLLVVDENKNMFLFTGILKEAYTQKEFSLFSRPIQRLDDFLYYVFL